MVGKIGIGNHPHQEEICHLEFIHQNGHRFFYQTGHPKEYYTNNSPKGGEETGNDIGAVFKHSQGDWC